MNFYDRELEALKRSGRYRERCLYAPSLIDLASNDYLGLAHERSLFDAAVQRVGASPVHGPKASMLVNGYHPIHRDFETALCKANGFEAGIVLGSGFNANIAMIEALVRRGDHLFMDEKYHASGLLASRLTKGEVSLFAHNDPHDLSAKLEHAKAGRRIIAVEGIYSMDGDKVERKIFDLADAYNAILIVDEAHSSGVIGKQLLGVFDYYGIVPGTNHIKMGTLGKAYGSFGAYILASGHIIDFLLNRAKPVIYATALSLFDTALGHAALEYMLAHAVTLSTQIAARRAIVTSMHDIVMDGLIAAIPVGDTQKALAIREALQRQGVLVGAIRPPTVSQAIVRLIARTSVDAVELESTCRFIRSALQ